jgi:hypothetical protein
MLSTTYGSGSTAPPDFSFSIAREYLLDTQGFLIVLTAAWAVITFASNARKTVAAIVVVNLATNLAFFLSYPIFTPYYLMPLAMLSVWTLLYEGNTSPAALMANGFKRAPSFNIQSAG